MSIYKKLHEFHKAFTGTKKTGKNTHFNSAHFELDEVVNVVRPILNDLGVIVYHYSNGEGALVTVLHDTESGTHIQSALPLKLTGTEHQIGSGITYFKRYNLCSLLNISEPDDDGNAATRRGAAQVDNTPVTSKQAATLRDHLEAVDGDEAAFCKYMKVSRIEDIPARSYETALATINRKRKA